MYFNLHLTFNCTKRQVKQNNIRMLVLGIALEINWPSPCFSDEIYKVRSEQKCSVIQVKQYSILPIISHVKKKNVACYSSSARIKPLATAVAHGQCTPRGIQDGEKQEYWP